MEDIKNSFDNLIIFIDLESNYTLPFYQQPKFLKFKQSLFEQIEQEKAFHGKMLSIAIEHLSSNQQLNCNDILHLLPQNSIMAKEYANALKMNSSTHPDPEIQAFIEGVEDYCQAFKLQYKKINLEFLL